MNIIKVSCKVSFVLLYIDNIETTFSEKCIYNNNSQFSVLNLNLFNNFYFNRLSI